MKNIDKGKFMWVLVRILLMQEFYYGILVVILAVSVGLQHGWESGLRAFFYSFVFLQFIILLLNRKVIRATLKPDVKDKISS